MLFKQYIAKWFKSKKDREKERLIETTESPVKEGETS
jgi:hypothetical protein